MGCCFGVPSDNFQEQKKILDIRNPVRSPNNQYDFVKANHNKMIGNQYFTKGEFEQAIKYYNLAINLFPNDINFYNNKIVCYKKLGKWQQCLTTCQIALTKDRQNIKTILFKGFSLAELSKQKVNFQQKKKMLLQASNLFQKVINTPHLNFRQEAQISKKKLIQLEKYYNKTQETNKEQEFRLYLQNRIISSSSIPMELTNFYSNAQQLNKDMDNFFSHFDSLQSSPEYYQDPISYEVYKNPYICSSGMTYEKDILMQYMVKHGKNDPITKQVFKIGNDPVPNKNLIEVIDKSKRVTIWRIQQNMIHNQKFINF